MDDFDQIRDILERATGITNERRLRKAFKDGGKTVLGALSKLNKTIPEDIKKLMDMFDVSERKAKQTYKKCGESLLASMELLKEYTPQDPDKERYNAFVELQKVCDINNKKFSKSDMKSALKKNSNSVLGAYYFMCS